MKNLILTLFLSVVALTTVQSQVQFGTGIDTDFGELGIAGKAKFNVVDKWGGQVGFSWFLNSPNASRLDLDATYQLTTAGDNDAISLKGLGGLNYWSSGVPQAGGELGVNIGANVTFPISDRIFYLEPRITIISNSAFFVGAGTYF